MSTHFIEGKIESENIVVLNIIHIRILNETRATYN